MTKYYKDEIVRLELEQIKQRHSGLPVAQNHELGARWKLDARQVSSYCNGLAPSQKKVRPSSQYDGVNPPSASTGESSSELQLLRARAETKRLNDLLEQSKPPARESFSDLQLRQ